MILATSLWPQGVYGWALLLVLACTTGAGFFGFLWKANGWMNHERQANQFIRDFAAALAADGVTLNGWLHGVGSARDELAANTSDIAKHAALLGSHDRRLSVLETQRTKDRRAIELTGDRVDALEGVVARLQP